MQFLEEQYIDIENVLSYRARIDVNKLGGILRFAEKNLDALGLDVAGNILFTVTESHREGKKRFIGVEILIPVNKAFESCEQYIYKPLFRLVNAVSVRCCGPYSEFDAVSCSLADFLRENGLKPISGIYYKVIRNNEEQPLEGIYDAFVSIDANKL